MRAMMALGFLLVAAVRPAAAGETTIRVGDTIAISAFGLADLDKKAVVEKSGEISYPLLGPIQAAGLSPGDLRRKVIDGLVQGGLARDPKIGVEIAAREPFYVTGDVIKPGAQPYALNVTVRSAVALAGGLDPGGARGARATANPAELQGQYETAALDYVKQRAKVRTLQAGLSGKKIEFDDFSDLPVQKDVIAELDRLVAEELKMRADQAEAEKAYLQNMIADTQAQIAALVSLQAAQQDGVRQETEQVARFKGLSDRGMVVQERLVDQKRALTMAQDKLFQTTATIASVRRLLEDLQHKRADVDAARRLALVKDLQDAGIAAAAAEARIAAIRLQMNIKTGKNQPQFVIYRENNDARDGRTRVDADEDFELQPGDIVEVHFSDATWMAAQ